jgi:hypothetical protein
MGIVELRSAASFVITLATKVRVPRAVLGGASSILLAATCCTAPTSEAAWARLPSSVAVTVSVTGWPGSWPRCTP